MAQYRAQDVISLLEQEARVMGVDPQQAIAFLRAENSSDGVLDPNAMLSLRTRSPAGAVGVGQVMPATWNSLIQKGLLKPSGNELVDQVRGMLAVIKDNESRTGGDPLLAAVHYNASYDTFKKFKETGDPSVLPLETVKYLEKVGKTLIISVTKNKIPGYAEDNVVAQAGSFLDGMRKNMSTLTSLTGDYLQAGETAKTAVDEGAAASVKKINAENAGKKATVDKRQGILAQFGLDVSQPDAILAAQNTDAAVAQQEARNLQKEITKLRSVDISSDPIGWLQAQFKLATVVPQFNDAATRYNNATQVIAQQQQLAHQQNALVPDGSKAALDAEAAAQSETALAAAKLQKSQIDMQQRTARLSELTTEMQWQGMAFQHATAMARLMAERVGMKEITDKASAEEKQLYNVNLLRVRMGKEPFASVAEFKAQTKEVQDRYVRNATTKSGSLTSNPGESFVLLYEENALESFKERFPEAAGFLNDISVQARRAANIARQTDKKSSSQELVSTAINDRFTKWREELKQREYDKLSPDNPFKMKAKLFAASPALKDNTIALHVKSLPAGAGELQERDVVEFAVGQIRAGKDKSKVARDVAEFFEQGAKFQHSQLGLGLLGVDARNPEKNVPEYPVSGDFYGIGARILNPLRSNVDFGVQMFQPASVERMLTLQAVYAMRTELSQLMTPGFAAPQATPLMQQMQALEGKK